MEKKIKTEDEEINIQLNPEVGNKADNIADLTSIRSNITTILSVNTSYSNYDPVAEKFKELEKRIDAWQNKFEFVNVRKK